MANRHPQVKQLVVVLVSAQAEQTLRLLDESENNPLSCRKQETPLVRECDQDGSPLSTRARRTSTETPHHTDILLTVNPLRRCNFKSLCGQVPARQTAARQPQVPPQTAPPQLPPNAAAWRRYSAEAGIADARLRLVQHGPRWRPSAESGRSVSATTSSAARLRR